MSKQDLPQDGEQFFHCGHMDDPHEKHFFELEPPAVMESPDGLTTESRWFVQCSACFKKYPGDLDRVAGVLTHVGDAPNIDSTPKIVTLD
jgi:hypothetical protein